jgi:hypothetical protein
MTQATGTHDRYDLAATGENVLEQLANVIENISPTETPFISNIGKTVGKNTLTEWLGDELPSATSVAKIDGDEFSGDTLAAPDRFGNYHQIGWKTLVISRRSEKLTKAARKSEMAYQLSKYGKALKRDKEYVLVGGAGPQAARVGNSTQAPLTANLSTWIITNDDRASGGTTGALTGGTDTYGIPTTAAADSTTTQAVSEGDLLTLVKDCYVAGGEPSMLMCSAAMKQKLTGYMFASTAARVATQTQDQTKNPSAGASALGSVGVWITDFGSLELIPNRFMRDRDIFILDPETWSVSYIDDMKVETLGKTHDSERKAIITDFALVSKAQKANAVLADAKVATAVVA